MIIQRQFQQLNMQPLRKPDRAADDATFEFPMTSAEPRPSRLGAKRLLESDSRAPDPLLAVLLKRLDNFAVDRASLLAR